MNDARIDIVIPTLDRPNTLRGAVLSVLSQSHGNIQVTVLDNGSSVPAATVLEDICDARLSIRRNNQTISRPDNYNLALRSGTAAFITILADDDELRPDFVTRTLALLDAQSDLVLVHTGYDAIDGEGHTISTVDAPIGDAASVIPGTDYIKLRLSGRHCTEFTATVLRRSALPVGGFVTEDDLDMDLALVLRMATQGNVGVVPTPLARVRRHSDAVSTVVGSELVDGRYLHSLEHRRVSAAVKMRFVTEYANSPATYRRLRRIAQRPLRQHLLVPAARSLSRPHDLPAVVRRALADTTANRLVLVEPGAWKRAVAAFMKRHR